MALARRPAGRRGRRSRGPCEADVAIVGAGYTGLWTAYYLKRARPDAADRGARARASPASAPRGATAAGSRASSRARRACTSAAADARPTRRCSARCSRPSMRSRRDRRARASTPTSSRAGGCAVALGRRRRPSACASELARARAHGLRRGGPARARAPRAGARACASRARAARPSRRTSRACTRRSCSRASPRRSRRLGVSIYEGTPGERDPPARGAHRRRDACARAGSCARPRATPPSLRGLRRALVPMNSSMIVTEPLAAAAWEEIGWSGREVLGDGAHVYVYLQRTDDGRIAIGGRGVPYRFGSRTDGAGETAPRDRREPAREARRDVPGRRRRGDRARLVGRARACRATGACRSTPTRTRVSPGPAATSARAWPPRTSPARTLRDLHPRRARRARPRCPGSGARPRRWEPEPLRWATIHGVYALYRHADRVERRSERPSRLGALVDAASGRA